MIAKLFFNISFKCDSLKTNEVKREEKYECLENYFAGLEMFQIRFFISKYLELLGANNFNLTLSE